MKKYLFIGILIGFGIATALSPLYIHYLTEKSVTLSEQSTQYPLLARRIFTQNPNDMIINFTGLRALLKSHIESVPEKFGIYFEYLPTGVHIGINDRDSFFRASLVKLPVIMKAYKLIEEGKIDKNEVLPITRNEIDQGYGTLWKEGKTEIILQEAIKLTLTESDNTAFRVVNNRVNKEIQTQGETLEKAIIEVYEYLDIPLDESGNTQSITPRNYGSILKSLFFSAYLSYDNSSEILNLLSQSIFTDWMSQPIPDAIRVSHKTGTFEAEGETSKNIHADCGIVYYPNRPYLLCIMINSSDKEIAYTQIRLISKMVYDYIDQVN